MRRCEAKVWKGRQLYPISGLFHQWGVGYEEFESGPGNFTTAIIELDDGQVVEAAPSTVKFLDSAATVMPRCDMCFNFEGNSARCLCEDSPYHGLLVEDDDCCGHFSLMDNSISEEDG